MLLMKIASQVQELAEAEILPRQQSAAFNNAPISKMSAKKPIPSLAQRLRLPEDLDRIEGIIREIIEKKAEIDGMLKAETEKRHGMTKSGMDLLLQGKRLLEQVKKEESRLGKLQQESQKLMPNFDQICLVTKIYENFQNVISMKNDIVSLDSRVADLNRMLDEDDADPSNRPNLLKIYFHLVNLRKFRTAVDEQSKRDQLNISELFYNMNINGGPTLETSFEQLTTINTRFEKALEESWRDFLLLTIRGHHRLIVSTALIIDTDENTRARPTARLESDRQMNGFSDGITTAQGEVNDGRSYKQRFIDSIEEQVIEKLKTTSDSFNSDPESLKSSLGWFFNDLKAMGVGLLSLLPKKWDTAYLYTEIYNRCLRDWFCSVIDNKEELSNRKIQVLLGYVDKHYSFMARLDKCPKEAYVTHIYENRIEELYESYRDNTIKYLTEKGHYVKDRDIQSFESNYHDLTADQLRAKSDSLISRPFLGADLWTLIFETMSGFEPIKNTDAAQSAILIYPQLVIEYLQDWELTRDRFKYELLDEIPTVWSNRGQWEGELSGVAAKLSVLHTYLAKLSNYLTTWLPSRQSTGMCPISSLTQRAASYIRDDSFDRFKQRVDDIKTILANFCIDNTKLIALTALLILLHEGLLKLQPGHESPALVQLMNSIREDHLQFEDKSVWNFEFRTLMVHSFIDELLVVFLFRMASPDSKLETTENYEEIMTAQLQDVSRFIKDCFARQGHGADDENYEDAWNRWRVVRKVASLVLADENSLEECFANLVADFSEVDSEWAKGVIRTRPDSTILTLRTRVVDQVMARMPRGEIKEGSIMARVGQMYTLYHKY